MNLSTVPVYNPGQNLMKSHEAAVNPGSVGALSNYEPDAVATRMAMDAGMSQAQAEALVKRVAAGLMRHQLPAQDALVALVRACDEAWEFADRSLIILPDDVPTYERALEKARAVLVREGQS